jgi:hypothetical protein
LPLRGFASVPFRNSCRVPFLGRASGFATALRGRHGAARFRRARLDVKPVVFLARQDQHRFAKGALDGAEGFPVCLFLFGALLLLNQAIEVGF